jgi:hypothetical protein
VKKLGKNALENLTLDTSCQIDLGSTVTAVDSSNYNNKITWGFNHDNPIQGDSTFRQQNSVVLDAIEADESTIPSTFVFDYNRVKNGKLILQKRVKANNINTVMAADAKTSASSAITDITKILRQNVTDIYIPFGVRSLYNFVFDSTGIENVHIPESITSIGKGAFIRTKLKEIVLPSSVATVAEQAFGSCENLEKADFSGTKVISLKNTFQSSTKLKEVFLPNTLEVIGLRLFYNCNSLTNITIPNSVTSIGEEAFRGCNSLTSITIPNSVTSIGKNAFFGCTNLKTITVKKSADSIENAPWGATNVEEVLWEEEK